MKKKFSYNGVASNMNTNSTTELTLVGEMYGGAVVTVSKYIEMDAMLSVVNSIVDTIADVDDATYRPELTECIIRIMILNAYAGIPVPENGLKKAYRVVMQSDLYEQISALIDPVQLEAIRSASMEKIEYNRALIIGALGHKMYEMIGQFNTAVSALTAMTEQFDSDDFKNAVQSITANYLPSVNKDSESVDDSGNLGDGNVVYIDRKPN